jgi:hypothetical protein
MEISHLQIHAFVGKCSNKLEEVLKMSASIGLIGLTIYAYYLLLGIGVPIFIVWFAVAYIKSSKERNNLLRELIEKIEK